MLEQNQPPHVVREMGASQEKKYGLRRGAEEFPLMLILSIIYPCNFGCPMCPYTDGNMFGPNEKQRDRLRRIIAAGIDLIEFSMDAADAELYGKLRPPRGGP